MREFVITVFWASLLFIVLVVQGAERKVIHIRSGEGSILNKTNLDRIKHFLLQKGETCTYCNMYNNNPCFETENFYFYLNPDPGGLVNHPQWNINSDPTKGDFNTLVIRKKMKKNHQDVDFGDQYRHIKFFEEHDIQLEAFYTDSKMSTAKMREFPEKAVKELLEWIEQNEKKELGKTD